LHPGGGALDTRVLTGPPPPTPADFDEELTMPTEMALKGTHERVLNLLERAGCLEPGVEVLDLGAGQGAFSARLVGAGVSVSACDVITDQFDVDGVQCRQIENSGALPFESSRFDLVVALEVVEHAAGHDRFFAEVARVLKPGGRLLFTTPNILSLKSRMLFLLTGTFYSFGPLEPFTSDPISQHIAPFNINRYTWMLSQFGLHIETVETDKYQTTSLVLSFLAPLVWFATRIVHGNDRHARDQNAPVTLFGRGLLVLAHKGQPAS
jgi:SAM-dependent methyltransferase